MSLLEESGLFPLTWNEGDGLPGHIDCLEHLLDFSWKNLYVMVFLEIFSDFIGGCVGVVLEQQ